MSRRQACVRAKPETVIRSRSCSLTEHCRYDGLLVCRGHTDDGAFYCFDVEMDQQPASTYSLDFLQQDCPAELPSWSFNENVLDDFREFIDGVQMSEAGQSDPLTSELERPSTSTTQDAVNEPSTSRTRPPRQLSKSHRQRQNQQAQQRYRQRQRVQRFLCLDHSLEYSCDHLASFEHYQVHLLCRFLALTLKICLHYVLLSWLHHIHSLAVEPL